MNYPHMCRDGHDEIGHSDSEHERCPLFRVIDERDCLKATVDGAPHAPICDSSQVTIKLEATSLEDWENDGPAYIQVRVPLGLPRSCWKAGL